MITKHDDAVETFALTTVGSDPDTSSSDTWHLACDIFAALKDRRAFLDRVGKKTSSLATRIREVLALEENDEG